MPAITVNVAVISENNILLTKREDFEVWCLPSGHVEDGESVAQAAIRETQEETGIDVELTALVGVYSLTGALPGTHAILFKAVPVGGSIQTQPGETIEVRYFKLDELPDDLSFGHRQRIADAFSGFGGGRAVTQEMRMPEGIQVSRQEIIDARTLPREGRLAFFQATMKQAALDQKTDVGL